MPLQTAKRLSFRISTQLYAAISFTVLLTIMAVIVSWLSFEKVGDSQQKVNEGSLPEMVVAFEIAKSSASLVAAAPRLTSALSIEELANVVSEINLVKEEFYKQLEQLRIIEGEHQNLDELGGKSEQLVSNIVNIEELMSQFFLVTELTDKYLIELNEFEENLRIILFPRIDEQFFYLMTGYSELDAEPVELSEHMSEREVSLYRFLSSLEKHINVAGQLLASVSAVNDIALIDVLRDQFESASDGINYNLNSIDNDAYTTEIKLLIDKLDNLGFGENNGFDLYRDKLEILTSQGDLIHENRRLAFELVDEVEAFVDEANNRALIATKESDVAIATAIQLLLLLGTIGVIVAILIAWLFVGRVLLRRLDTLSRRMRGMAKGELEEPVNIKGKDEIADMAAALEVFRAHALEVQRLNLVEKLATEVREKNQELESVLDELRTAQTQIVMREKLAALGELTAGVAHEIKNPLNFVKNFSEASEELLTELDEALAMTDETREEQLEEIKSIADILHENLGRIKHHGGRADRIVHDMLSMGRGEGHAHEVDLNILVDENAKLAYHGARATTEGLQLRIVRDLDQEVGKVVLIPQDMGRVILNMVGNACYETNNKLQKIKSETLEGEPVSYMPELKLTTKRHGSRISIAVRDNGNGIQPDIISRIFNPFFTTKPTDKGTGLGLSLSNDIIRRHGGTIDVQSEVGEYTEMTIDIPDDSRHVTSHPPIIPPHAPVGSRKARA